MQLPSHEGIGCTFWAMLQLEDTRETIRSTSRALEVIASDLFAKNG
jgi:hypothetical protein